MSYAQVPMCGYVRKHLQVNSWWDILRQQVIVFDFPFVIPKYEFLRNGICLFLKN